MVIQITAVPTVSRMVGVNRVLRGQRVTCVLGDSKLTKEQDKMLRRRYIMRALEIAQMHVEKKRIYTLEGSE